MRKRKKSPLIEPLVLSFMQETGILLSREDQATLRSLLWEAWRTGRDEGLQMTLDDLFKEAKKAVHGTGTATKDNASAEEASAT